MRVMFSVLLLVAVCQVRVDAAPGMTWAQEKAWLSSNAAVDAGSIHHGYDADLGVKTASARLRMPKRSWDVRVNLTTSDVVTEEAFLPSNGGGKISSQGGPVVAALIQTAYGGSDVAIEYANAKLVTSVPINGERSTKQFFAAKNGRYGFMLDPYEVVVFSASELNSRIKQARYCSTHTECGE